jgi:hypothetical protein
MAGKFNFPFFDQAQAGSKPVPVAPPVMPATNQGTLQPPDEQGVPPAAVPLQDAGSESATFGQGSSV